MCGRVNVAEHPFVDALMTALGAAGQGLRTAEDIAPGAQISMVRQAAGQRLVDEACWWLLLHPDTLKPNYRYASFNCRSDKLHQPLSASYQAFRTQRCIIPVSGFVEGLGDKKHYFHLAGESAALAMGGVYREWISHETGEMRRSVAIITLPPHPRLKDIHPKSMPLLLPWHDTALVARWLDQDCDEVDSFDTLLQPHIPQALRVCPVDRPSTRRPVGESFLLAPDAA